MLLIRISGSSPSRQEYHLCQCFDLIDIKVIIILTCGFSRNPLCPPGLSPYIRRSSSANHR